MKSIEKVYRKDYSFVDVRSPKEFEEDHIPGAINIPLFSDEERAIVGTIYTKESKDKAMEKGLEFISPKLPEMIKQYKKLKQPILVYCWRGGMRSGSITSLLKSMKFEIYKLENGYKDYRRFVREQLDKVKIPPMIVIYGLTGSGKTEMINQVKNSIDLEGLAQHRGSIFGDVNLKPNSQKRFESLLLKRLIEVKDQNFVFVEGESRKIGKNIIHERFWKHMQKAIKVKVINTMEERVKRIYDEYCVDIDIELLKSKTKMIEKHMGKKKANEIIELLDKKEINKVIEILLIDYYDQLYKHTVDSKKYSGEIHNLQEMKALDFKTLRA